MTSLSERAMIAKLSLGIWSGMSVDPDVSEEVSENHKADLKQAGRYSKRLVANHYMREITSTANMARQTHRLLTLPWDDNGSRILSTRGFMHYTTQMRLRRQACETAFDNFCTPENVDNYKKEAKVRLGTMFDAEEYPSSDEMRKKFGFRVDINKVPEGGDFRADLTADQVKGIVKDIESRTEECIEHAKKDVFRRVCEVAAKMSERLKAYSPANDGKPSENRFKDSLVLNVVELAQLMPTLNVTEDPKITALQQQIMNDLGQHSPEVLRDDSKLRNATAKKADEIFAKVKKFL